MGDDVMQFSNPISEAAEQSPRDGSTIANNTISVDNFDSDHDSDLDDPTRDTGQTNTFAMMRVMSSQTVMKKASARDEREQKRLEAIEFMSANYVISPDGKFRKRWDAAQIFLLAYVAIVVPYRIGFTHDIVCNKDHCEAFFFWDAIVDLYFIIDIFMSFRTAYWNSLGELEYQPRRIVQNYLRTWFAIDTAGCLPVNYVVLLLDDAEAAADARFNKTLRLLKLARLLKLLRLMRLNRLIQRYEEEFYALASGFAMLKILIAVGVIGHWLACLWYYMGALHDPAAIRPDGTQIVGWVENHFGGAAEDAGYAPRYLMSIYWAFMTMTTVGYGDISAGTTYEKWTAVFGMLIGGFTFGLIVGSLGEMARKANPGNSVRSKRIGHLSAYLAGRGVSSDLMRRVRVYFSNHYTICSVFGTREVEDYYSRLPKEVGYLSSAKGPSILSQVGCFSHIDELSAIIICSRMKTLTFPKSNLHADHSSGEFVVEKPERDYVYRKGEKAYEMYVVIDGRLIFETDDGEQSAPKGHCIDERAMLLPPESPVGRAWDTFAPVECSVAALSAEDLMALRIERVEIDRQVRPFAQAAKEAEMSRQIRMVFEQVDDDGNGTLDSQEFAEVMRCVSMHFTENNSDDSNCSKFNRMCIGIRLMGAGGNADDLADIFSVVDADNTGVISRPEFEQWWRSNEAAHADDDGGTISVLETLQNRVREIDESSTEIEYKLARIQQLIAQKLN